MKTYYTVISTFMNGTVPVGTDDIASFTSKELAEKTKAAVIDANKGSFFPVRVRIQKTNVYESEDEVPILNKDNKINF